VFAATPYRSNSVSLRPIVVFGVLAIVLALRLAHLSSAMLSPLSYQPGPDEDYYLRFGQAVAAGQGEDTPEFTFLDPGYGYLLGALFRLAGVNLFAVYMLQAMVDTATAFGILAIGRLLGRPRAGLCGALLYGITTTAIMYTTTLLKETWATSYLTWWVAGALVLIRSERKLAWLLFGAYCGTGVALRSNLLLLGALALLLPHFCAQPMRTPRNRSVKAALIACGMVVALLPWSVRNAHAYGSFSPLPHNGGIELHQVYNAENPGSELWIPAFVSYLEPREIWRGYSAEASKREGRSLAPPEVDRYWRDEALSFIRQHPAQVLRDMLRKTLNFLSAAEVPDNRSTVEERLFSPVLKLLPAPTAWLMAMGLAGLVWLVIEDRRWPIIAAPIFVAWFTVAVFFSQDRFRFLAVPMLAVCSGIWIDQIAQDIRDRRKRQVVGFAALASVVAAVSMYLGTRNPAAPVRWDQIAWGYIKMGKIPEARALAERIAGEQPENGAILEALGFTAIARQQYSEAVDDYERAIKLRPRSHVAHYNLARVFLVLGDRKRSAEEAKIALILYPSPDYRALLTQIESEQ
jgi:4-amino-4-deoxy-L-arabinose transferase-like glycosyltransferase